MRNIIKTISILMTAAVLWCFSVEAVRAEGEDVKLSIPGGHKIDKETDLTAAMLTRLLGPSWGEINGTKSSEAAVAAKAKSEGASASEEGMGVYSNLIVAILGVLNMGALVFVSVSILYMWGIFVVTTAHDGSKLGGSMYNSLWIPIRHVCAFSLTIPVLNGLSMMQIAVIACVGFSLNFANNVWDAAGDYIVNNAHVGIIDSSSPMLEAEAFELIPIMFESSVLNIIEQHRGIVPVGATLSPPTPGSHSPYSLESQSVVLGMTNGNTPMTLKTYVEINQNPGIGKAKIYVSPLKSVDKASLGAVTVSYPQMECSFDDSGGFNGSSMDVDADFYGDMGNYTCRPPKDAIMYDLQKQLANIRIEEIMNLWLGDMDKGGRTGVYGAKEGKAVDSVAALADKYLASYSSAGTGCVRVPTTGKCIDALVPSEVNANIYKAVQVFRGRVTTRSEKQISQIMNNDEKTRKAIELAIDSSGGKSKYGWISAGLFTFTLASIQKKIDEGILTRAEPTYPSAVGDIVDSSSFWNYIVRKKVADAYDKTEMAAFNNVPKFVTTHMMATERYSASSAGQVKGEMVREIVTKVVNAFVSNSDASGGRTPSVLSTVLKDFAVYDPIVVMQTFGERMLNVLPTITGISVGISFFADMTFAFGLIGMMAIVGCTFAFIAPITPVIFWLKAVFSWVYMVVEVLVAAPFWVCTHALPEGPGFAGQHARRGYMMLLDIVCRPTLLVLGAVFAIAIIQACGWLFNVIFNSWFAKIGSSFIQIGIIGDITYAVLVMSTMYYLSFVVFTRGVNYLPERVMQWCGSGDSGMGLRDEHDGTMAIVAAGGVAGKMQSGLTSGLGTAAGGLKSAKNAMAKGLSSPANKNDVGQITSA